MSSRPRATAGRSGATGEDRAQSLLSASALMAAGTVLSRIVGFGRVALLAFVLGNGTRQVDAFTLANSLPNSLYILFAGGALNTVFVPQLVRAARHDADRGEAYANRIMTAFLGILGVVTVLLVLGSGLVLEIYASDAWRAPALERQYQAMLGLTMLCMPQVFFYGVFFIAGQILNARERFGPMMWAPVVNNVLSVVVLVLYLVLFGQSDGLAAFSRGEVWLLGGGSTLGIVAQTVTVLVYLRRSGFRYRPRWDFRGTGLRHTFNLARWTIGFVIVTQVAVAVVTRIGSSATTASGYGAGLTVYHNAYLLWMLPHSIITVSLVTAMLPTASRHAAEHDLGAVASESNRTIRLATSALLPAAAAFVVLAEPMAELLFGHGRGSSDAELIGWALVALAVGLVPFTIHHVVQRTFYALEDTRSTFVQQLVISAVYAGGAYLLVRWLSRPDLVAVGLGLAYSLSYIVGLAISFPSLRRKVPQLDARPLVVHLGKLVVAVLPGAAAAWGLGRLLRQAPNGPLTELLGLAGGAALIVGSVLVLGSLLHIEELRLIVRLVRSRLPGARPRR